MLLEADVLAKWLASPSRPLLPAIGRRPCRFGHGYHLLPCSVRHTECHGRAFLGARTPCGSAEMNNSNIVGNSSSGNSGYPSRLHEAAQQTSRHVVRDVAPPPTTAVGATDYHPDYRPPTAPPRLRPGPSENHPALAARPSSDGIRRDEYRDDARLVLAADIGDAGVDGSDSRDEDGAEDGARGAAGSSSAAAGAGSGPSAGASKPVTACFNCRALRQKCDRKMPCSRCTLRHRPCRYPSGSNRGRKHGNSLYVLSAPSSLSFSFLSFSLSQTLLY